MSSEDVYLVWRESNNVEFYMRFDNMTKASKHLAMLEQMGYNVLTLYAYAFDEYKQNKIMDPEDI